MDRGGGGGRRITMDDAAPDAKRNRARSGVATGQVRWLSGDATVAMFVGRVAFGCSGAQRPGFFSPVGLPFFLGGPAELDRL